MEKTILVPVDGSIASLEAIKFAITMAKAYGDQIKVVNIQQSHKILGESIINDAETVLKKEDIPYSSMIRIGTPPSIEIISEAKDDAVRCIVMGSKGSGNSSKNLGSVSSAVLKISPCPVVIVPSSE